MSNNVVLIGMMGSGKTTVGRLLAEKAEMEFVDLDEMIEKRTGKRIAQIFEEEGEQAFRLLETEALREVLAANRTVIATGGGIVTRPENRRLLREAGLVVWLDAPAEELSRRIGSDQSRPLLRGHASILKQLEQLLAERRVMYAETSDIHLDTTEHTPEEIAERILEELENRTLATDEEVFATIVAIDGPVASGKSALARRLARRLGFTHIDTGAMYRCVTYEAMRRGIPLDDEKQVTDVAHSIDIRFLEDEGDSEHKRVLLNGEDVTEVIRSPEVSRNTSPIADIASVRTEMVRLQRQLALRGRCVLEGRDIATVVVPEAKWKFYVVASLEERVQRRHRQYVAEGREVPLERIREDILSRDERDRNRAHGALKLAPTAMILDTTGIGLEEAVEIMAAIIEMSEAQG
jgi:cytidylate kinase